MSDRLESLRASIKASQPRVPKVGLLEEDEPNNELSEPSVDDFESKTSLRNIADFVNVQGTPLYMSPEQCANAAETSDTDVYSLGVMMFELLEGHPPYVASTLNEVLMMHLDAPVPDQVSEFTPQEVKDLVARMLSKRPEQRPDMGEVVSTLQRFVQPAAADVDGLDEESWTVSDVAESDPNNEEAPGAVDAAPASTTGEIPISDEVSEVAEEEAAFFNSPLDNMGSVDATWDVKEGEEEQEESSKPPIWIFGVLLVLVCGVVGALVMAGGDDPDEAGAAKATGAEEPVAVAEVEPEPEPEVAPEPEPEPEPEPAAFAFGEADAGSADAGTADAGAAEEPPVIEEPEPEPEPVEVEPEPEPEPKPKPKRKRKRKPRPKPKPKPKLQELRL